MPSAGGWTGCVPLISTTAPAPANNAKRAERLSSPQTPETEVRYSVGPQRGGGVRHDEPDHH
jgi:hypothetical protein